MGRPTKAQHEESKRRAHTRCKLIAGWWIATERPPEDHGKPWVAEFFGCQCGPCRAADGSSNAEIATEVRRRKMRPDASAATVASDLSGLYRRLGAKGRIHAVSLCYQRGILTVPCSECGHDPGKATEKGGVE